MAYAVETPVFTGPFDLLLHLILREEVDLYEISLSTIVDAYLAELSRIESFDLEVATEFVLIAAILVELKTKRLLPDERDLDLEDEFGLWEQRDLLLSRLVECKTFKDASSVLAALMRDAGRSHPRTCGPEDHFADLAPDVLDGVTPAQLLAAFHTGSRPRPAPRVTLDHITLVHLSVPDAMVEVADELRRSGRLTFRELTAGLVEKIEVIVRFLAVLELYKQGVVELDQLGRFGDITVEWLGDPVVAAFDLELVDAYDG